MTDFDAEPAVTALRAGALGALPTPSPELHSWFVSPPLPDPDVAGASSWRRRLVVWLGGLGLGAKLALGAGVAVASVGLAGTAEVLPGPVQAAFDHSVGRGGGSGDPQPDLPDRAPTSPSTGSQESSTEPTPTTSTSSTSSTSPTTALTGEPAPVSTPPDAEGPTVGASAHHDGGGDEEPSGDDTSGVSDSVDSPDASEGPEGSDGPTDPESADVDLGEPEGTPDESVDDGEPSTDVESGGTSPEEQ
jgi:hypothetical protein